MIILNLEVVGSVEKNESPMSVNEEKKEAEEENSDNESELELCFLVTGHDIPKNSCASKTEQKNVENPHHLFHKSKKAQKIADKAMAREMIFKLR